MVGFIDRKRERPVREGFTKKLRRGHGQALVLVMLALPLFFSVAAVVVDGTNLMVNKRQMQNASDAAALAAAQGLRPAIAAMEACAGDSGCRLAVQNNPAFTGNVDGTAEAYVVKNWKGGTPPTLTRCSSAGDTNCWSWPYQKDIYGPDPSYNDNAYHFVQVKLERSVTGFFASLAGVSNLFDVGARAVAAALQQPVTGTQTIVDPGSTNTYGTPDHRRRS